MLTASELYELYRISVELERKIVVTAALGYGEADTTAIWKILSEVSQKNAQDLGIKSNKDLAEVIRKLVKKGLLLQVNGYIHCEPELIFEVFLDVLNNRLFKDIMENVVERYPLSKDNQTYYLHNKGPRSYKVCLRDAHIALFSGDLPKFAELQTLSARFFPNEKSIREVLLGNKQIIRVLDKIEPSSFAPIVNAMWLYKIDDSASFDDLFNIVKERAFDATTIYAEMLLMRLDLKELVALFSENETLDNWYVSYLEAFFLLLRGNLQESEARYALAHKKARTTFGVKKGYPPSFMGWTNFFLLLRQKKYAEAAKLTEAFEETGVNLMFYRIGKLFVSFLMGDKKKENFALPIQRNVRENLVVQLVMFWTDTYPKDSSYNFYLTKEVQKLSQNGYYWVAWELLHIANRLSPSAFFQKQIDKITLINKDFPLQPMVDMVEKITEWERTLDALTALVSTKTATNAVRKDSRLVWFLTMGETITIQPKEQTILKNGNWSKGRAASLQRIAEGAIENMTEHDRRVARAVRKDVSYYNNSYFLDMSIALEALVGHPFLFLEPSGVSIELVRKEPEITIEEKGKKLLIRMVPSTSAVGVICQKETPTRYLIYVLKEEHARISSIMGENGIQIPLEGKEKLVAAIRQISSLVNIHSSIETDIEDVPKVEGNPKIHVHLLPQGEGLRVELYVKPFTDEPPYLKPASGSANLIADIKGQRMVARRDLKKEQKNLKTFLEVCPSLHQAEAKDKEWLLEDPELCLQMLVELSPLKEADIVNVEWPKGEKFKITRMIDARNFSLNIRKETDWFSMNGELRVSEDIVLTLKELLALTNSSKGRFVELSQGNFLALTNAFRKKLKELSSWAQETKTNDVRVHKLAAFALEDFTDDIGDLVAAKEWQKTISRFTEAKQKRFKLPSTFRAELRPYQQEGYEWLQRMAYWGVGACLADDMGLGKTIQALALLTDRAKDGASLVVAPTSVTRNWVREAQKFAPSLNTILFSEGNRKDILNSLQSFDLLIVSYGLIQQEDELFKEIKFNTIVLDEAQAIKNRNTKRSKAVMELHADFKLITTGTPVENHLGELWNLFNFINPGLLGSWNHFTEKFINPIERNEDNDRRHHLRKLISPFILRRRKNEVLDELPSKTEITINVTLSEAEEAFYEALRSQAVENIAQINAQTDNSGERQLRVLAEIMRLRRACCNPKLVNDQLDIGSAKLEAFGNIVEELIENGHKALVFSQFVGHLRLIEAFINEKSIAYQYLDGQTPPKIREDRVRAFQAGEGDLFLISLRAGGVGLNLTAADYVIHMDPWWNPAVEDQASDRAHRIGQQRPVTVYRLVAERTIEEKIIQLHQHKRDLADSLLEGADGGVKLSADELIDLIKS